MPRSLIDLRGNSALKLSSSTISRLSLFSSLLSPPMQRKHRPKLPKWCLPSPPIKQYFRNPLTLRSSLHSPLSAPTKANFTLDGDLEFPGGGVRLNVPPIYGLGPKDLNPLGCGDVLIDRFKLKLGNYDDSLVSHF